MKLKIGDIYQRIDRTNDHVFDKRKFRIIGIDDGVVQYLCTYAHIDDYIMAGDIFDRTFDNFLSCYELDAPRIVRHRLTKIFI